MGTRAVRRVFIQFSQTFTSDNVVMVSLTKFSIVISFSRTYLSCNRHAITWAPIHIFCFWILVLDTCN